MIDFIVENINDKDNLDVLLNDINSTSPTLRDDLTKELCNLLLKYSSKTNNDVSLLITYLTNSTEEIAWLYYVKEYVLKYINDNNVLYIVKNL